MPSAPKRTFASLPAGANGKSTNPETIARNKRRHKLSPLDAEYERARANRGNRVSSKLKRLRKTDDYVNASDDEHKNMEQAIRDAEEAIYQSDRAAIAQQYAKATALSIVPTPPGNQSAAPLVEEEEGGAKGEEGEGEDGGEGDESNVSESDISAQLILFDFQDGRGGSEVEVVKKKVVDKNSEGVLEVEEVEGETSDCEIIREEEEVVSPGEELKRIYSGRQGLLAILEEKLKEDAARASRRGKKRKGK